MTKVNELNITINKAVITRVAVELDPEKDKPTWYVSGSLLTKENRQVADFSFSTESWQEKNKIDAPIEVNLSARDIFLAFTPVILEKLGNMYKALPQPK